MIAFLLLLALSPVEGLAQGVPESVVFEKDVVYGKTGEVELKLNLAKPKDAAGKLPCVLVIHGGGWAAGNKEGHNNLTWEFAKRGFVSATIGYRLAPKFLFPAQVEDVKCAVRYLRANAEKLNVDPDRMGAVGFSAGAHLSMMLGAMGKADGLEGDGGNPEQPSQVQCVVAYFGPTDFVNVEFPEASRGIVARWIGGSREEKKEQYRLASPVTWVSRGDAPMLLIQGTQDPLVPHDQAVRMAEALTAAGVPGRVELLVGAGHGWGGAELLRSADITYAYFEQKLKAAK